MEGRLLNACNPSTSRGPRREEDWDPCCPPFQSHHVCALYCPVGSDGHSHPGFQSVHRQRPCAVSGGAAASHQETPVLITWGWCVALNKSPYFCIMSSLGVCPFWMSFQLISSSPSNVLRGQCGKSCGVEQTLKKHLWPNEWMNEWEKNWRTRNYSIPVSSSPFIRE